jgi:hypothetical protein
MSDISRRLEQFLSTAQRKEAQKDLLPIKTADGILVGDVLIVSNENIKHLYQKNLPIYEGLFLNAVTIKLANLLAKRGDPIKIKQLYEADQEYGKWFTDSQLLRTRYQKAIDSQDYDRADILFARYCESRDRALAAKNIAQGLASL